MRENKLLGSKKGGGGALAGGLQNKLNQNGDLNEDENDEEYGMEGGNGGRGSTFIRIKNELIKGMYGGFYVLLRSNDHH